MGIEIVHDHCDFFGIRILLIGQFFHGMSPIGFGPTLRDFDMSPLLGGREKHKQVARAVAFVLMVIATIFTGLHGNRNARFFNVLFGRFVHTNKRML